MAKEKKSSKKEMIRTFFKAIQKQKADIEAASKGQYKTDGLFDMNRLTINLKTERNVLRLRDGVAALLEKFSYQDKANELLGLESSNLIQGVSKEDWLEDFKVSVVKLQLIERRKKLEHDEAELMKMDPTLLADIKMEEMAAKYAEPILVAETMEATKEA